MSATYYPPSLTAQSTWSPPVHRSGSSAPTCPPTIPTSIGRSDRNGHQAAYLDVLLGLTAQFRRMLTRYGSIAIELADTMAGSGGAGGDYNTAGFRDGQPKWKGSGSTENSAMLKSHCMIPEAYRFALVWGINPFTGEPSPAGRWIVRNVVDWCRRNPTPGDDGDKFRRATSDIVCATVDPNRWWDGEPVRVPAGSDTHPRTAKGIALRTNDTPKANAGGNTNRDTLAIQHLGDGTRPLYDWWDLSSDPYPGAHYAVLAAGGGAQADRDDVSSEGVYDVRGAAATHLRDAQLGRSRRRVEALDHRHDRGSARHA